MCRCAAMPGSEDDLEDAPQGKFQLAFSAQGRSAGPEAGRGVPTPPSLPLDSTHPATGQGLHALDNPKEVGYTGKN